MDGSGGGDTFPEAGSRATWIACAAAVGVGAGIEYITLELGWGEALRYAAVAVVIVFYVAIALLLIERSRQSERLLEARRREEAARERRQGLGPAV